MTGMLGGRGNRYNYFAGGDGYLSPKSSYVPPSQRTGGAGSRGGYTYTPDRYRYPAGNNGPYGGTRMEPVPSVGHGFDGFGYEAFGRAIPGYAALASLDPEQTRKNAAEFNRWLALYWWNYGEAPPWFNQLFASYANVSNKLTFSVNPTSYTLYCSGTPEVYGFGQGSTGLCGSAATWQLANQNKPWSLFAGHWELATAGPFIRSISPGTMQAPPVGNYVWNGVTLQPKVMVMPTQIGAVRPEPAASTETKYSGEPPGRPGIRLYQRPVEREIRIPGGVVKNPPPHNQLPPPRGTKEDKRKANYGAAGKAYGLVTEFQDFQDCAVGAVKAGRKANGLKAGGAPGRWDPAQRSKYIVENVARGNFDMESFVECIATQQVTDDLLGAASKNIDRRFREKGYLNGLRGINGGRPSGFATGPLPNPFSGSTRMR